MSCGFAFIPNRLNIPNRPDLLVFPLNTLFASSKKLEDGRSLRGKALYKPDIKSLKTLKGNRHLTYHNPINQNWRLEIIYNLQTGAYNTTKYNQQEKVLWAFGSMWKSFFINLTMRGLVNGEPCELKTY